MEEALDWWVFDGWMKKMKAAWESKDPQAAAGLCSEEGFEYYENIFKPPLTTKAQVEKVWQEVPTDQSEIHFKYEILLTTPEEGFARFRVAFESKLAGSLVELDGIFIVKLDKKGLCKEFKQWWVKK